MTMNPSMLHENASSISNKKTMTYLTESRIFEEQNQKISKSKEADKKEMVKDSSIPSTTNRELRNCRKIKQKKMPSMEDDHDEGIAKNKNRRKSGKKKKKKPRDASTSASPRTSRRKPASLSNLHDYKQKKRASNKANESWDSPRSTRSSIRGRTRRPRSSTLLLNDKLRLDLSSEQDDSPPPKSFSDITSRSFTSLEDAFYASINGEKVSSATKKVFEEEESERYQSDLESDSDHNRDDDDGDSVYGNEEESGRPSSWLSLNFDPAMDSPVDGMNTNLSDAHKDNDLDSATSISTKDGDDDNNINDSHSHDATARRGDKRKNSRSLRQDSWLNLDFDPNSLNESKNDTAHGYGQEGTMPLLDAVNEYEECQAGKSPSETSSPRQNPATSVGTLTLNDEDGASEQPQRNSRKFKITPLTRTPTKMAKKAVRIIGKSLRNSLSIDSVSSPVAQSSRKSAAW